MIFLFNGLIAAGAAILAASLLPVTRLISRLSPGNMRRNWSILRALIFLFIAGYIGYAAVEWKSVVSTADMFVPGIFLLGACFVFLVGTLSLQTTVDIQRMAVMEHENITDPLMGIHNRRYLDRRLKEEVDRALRYKLPLSVLMLDIDRFKKVNDVYGHQVGDRVLCSLGKLIQNTVRNTDVVARYGGEEILIIATCTPPPPIPLVAERLRRTIEESVLVPPNELTCGEEIRVTVSIGVASLGPQIRTADALVKCADEAMYRAKTDGRNRVVVQGPDPLLSTSPGA
jgi:diguanylate cyclase (GGDEF)-like protein